MPAAHKRRLPLQGKGYLLAALLYACACGAWASPEPDALRFHIQAGGLFTTDLLSAPGAGRPWFGGSLQAGYALARLGKNREILVAGGYEWADPDPAGYAAYSSDFSAAQFGFAYQNLDRNRPGLGFRIHAGARRFFAVPENVLREKVFPLVSMAGIAQGSGGIYFYLEMGCLAFTPISVGVGFNL